MIPCLNEESTLPLTLSTIPKKIKGIDSIEVLVINDLSLIHISEPTRPY